MTYQICYATLPGIGTRVVYGPVEAMFEWEQRMIECGACLPMRRESFPDITTALTEANGLVDYCAVGRDFPDGDVCLICLQ